MNKTTIYETTTYVITAHVTYSDLIQVGIFICTLVGLCYAVFKGQKKK